MMNFNETVKHITGKKGKKFRLSRGLQWIERFIEAAPAKDKKFLRDWFNNKGNLDRIIADFYRGHFINWQKEEKSRTARKSRSRHKVHKRTDEEQKKLFRDVERIHGREGAKMFIEEIRKGK
jgi:hypothetical protein